MNQNGVTHGDVLAIDHGCTRLFIHNAVDWGKRGPLIARVVQSYHHFMKILILSSDPKKIKLRHERLTLTRIGHLHTTGVLQQSS